MSKKVLIFLCVVACGANAAVAPFITKCSASDSKCARNSGQAAVGRFAAGLPELGVEKLDPIKYEHIDASSRDLKLILNNIDISGVTQCEIIKIQRDAAKSKIVIRAICDLQLEGLYEMDGRLLFLPIKGKGPIHAKLNRLQIEVIADMGEKIKDGKKYWDIKTWKHTYELKAKAVLDLENLFEGNDVLGRAARDLLKSSANEVIGEVGPPIIKAILAKVVKNVDKFFHKVPAEELALD